LLAIARSGQAISVVTRSAVPDDLHVLGPPMPALPDIGISLAYASLRPSAVVRAFGAFVGDHLRRGSAQGRPGTRKLGHRLEGPLS
jgi:DNA-binding transcriptional LysR family regulator